MTDVAARTGLDVLGVSRQSAPTRRYRGAVIGLGGVARGSHIPGFMYDTATRNRLEIVATVDGSASVEAARRRAAARLSRRTARNQRRGFRRHLHAHVVAPRSHDLGARAGLSRAVREAGGAHYARSASHSRRVARSGARRNAVSSVSLQSGMGAAAQVARRGCDWTLASRGAATCTG